MLSYSDDPEPMLVVDDEIFHGINIIEKLHAMKESDQEARNLYRALSRTYATQTSVPRIGFRLEHTSAVHPTKRISDVGYDITVVAATKKLTQLTTLYETFISLEVPLGYYVELMPRSSLSKTGYMLANSVGIIDPCYTGTIKVPLIKVDQSMPDLQLPARVGQLLLKPYVISEAYDATRIDKTDTVRGIGGFGST